MFVLSVGLKWSYSLFCDGLQGEVLVHVKCVDMAGGFLNGDESFLCEGDNKPSTCPQTRGDFFHSNG